METNHSKKTISYRIDSDNIIDSVSNNWSDFAEKNYGENICNPINVVGFSIFDFIQGAESKHLYEIILNRVRNYMRSATFQFRCDSPEKRRFLNLSIIPSTDYAVEFFSQVVRLESRETMGLLKNDIERSDDFVRICCMCKKIAISNTEWTEIENAIIALKLFEMERLPNLTHGLCQACYDEVMVALDKLS